MSQAATRAVQSAIDHGVTLFDTSETYGPFTSETMLGKGARQAPSRMWFWSRKLVLPSADDPDNPGYKKIAERDSSAQNIIARM